MGLNEPVSASRPVSASGTGGTIPGGTMPGGTEAAPPRPPRPPLPPPASGQAEAADPGRLHQPLSLPHLHVLQLFGKHLGVRRRGERLLAEDGRGLVLP